MPRRTTSGTRRRRSSTTYATAEIGRFDGEIKSYAFTQGETVGEFARRAGFSIGQGETINDNRGNEIESTEVVKEGVTYYITGNYKQGA